MSIRSDDVRFWEPRYAAGATPWDFGGVPLALRRWLLAPHRRGRVLIPGCGSGYELRAFNEAGWNVTALDYAPAAVARAKANSGDGAAEVVLADFFDGDFGRNFDVIYERTFLCSMPPDRWPSYIARMAELLGSGGLVVGHFYFGQNDDPPPYPLTDETQHALFTPLLRKLQDDLANDSLPMFAGCERWQVWQKVGVRLQIDRFSDLR